MIYLILFLGLMLRLINLNQSLWLDEAIGAMVVKNMNLWEIVTKFALLDNHPPLYYLILKLWASIFGFSEISLRLPSVIFAIGTIFLIFKITKNKIAALLLATSPLFIYFSQEARMYMMAAFLATLSVYFLLKNKFFFLSLTLASLLFTDYVPVFFFPVFLIYAVYRKKNIKEILLVFIPTLILGLIWLPTFISQIEAGRTLTRTLPAWQNLSGGATIKQALLFWNKLILGRISFYPKIIYFISVIVASIPFLLVLVKNFKKEKVLFWLWFIVPPALGWIFSFVFPVFIYFRFLFVVPAFYVLVSNTKNKVLAILMLLVNLVGLGIYVFDNNQHREDWRNAVSFVESRLKDDELVVINYPEPFAPYKWYSVSGRVVAVADSVSVREDLTRNKVSKLTNYSHGLYYFYYLESLTDPNGIVRSEITNLGFKSISKFSFSGVGEVEYYIRQ